MGPESLTPSYPEHEVDFAEQFGQEMRIRKLFEAYFEQIEGSDEEILTDEQLVTFERTFEQDLGYLKIFLQKNDPSDIVHSLCSNLLMEKSEGLIAAIKFEKEDLFVGKFSVLNITLIEQIWS